MKTRMRATRATIPPTTAPMMAGVLFDAEVRWLPVEAPGGTVKVDPGATTVVCATMVVKTTPSLLVARDAVEKTTEVGVVGTTTLCDVVVSVERVVGVTDGVVTVEGSVDLVVGEVVGEVVDVVVDEEVVEVVVDDEVVVVVGGVMTVGVMIVGRTVIVVLIGGKPIGMDMVEGMEEEWGMERERDRI
jgi:hypothetical protein